MMKRIDSFLFAMLGIAIGVLIAQSAYYGRTTDAALFTIALMLHSRNRNTYSIKIENRKTKNDDRNSI